MTKYLIPRTNELWQSLTLHLQSLAMKNANFACHSITHDKDATGKCKSTSDACSKQAEHDRLEMEAKSSYEKDGTLIELEAIVRNADLLQCLVLKVFHQKNNWVSSNLCTIWGLQKAPQHSQLCVA